MTWWRRSAIAFVTLFCALAIAVVGHYWWASTEPRRPSRVSADAVFLWAPYVWYPTHNGWWIACWEDSGHNRCRLSNVDGSTEYEGEFTPYGHKGPISRHDLRIDKVKTRENRVWVGKALVPLVYLENGEILIPTSSYEKGTRLVDELKFEQK